MKLTPSYTLASSPRRPHHPLELLLGCLILLLSVGAHYFALGSKSDPALLAYDESSSWRQPALQLAGGASEVLFASHQEALPMPSAGTILTTTGFSFERPASLAVPSVLTPASSSLEATLLTLNFGY